MEFTHERTNGKDILSFLSTDGKKGIVLEIEESEIFFSDTLEMFARKLRNMYEEEQKQSLKEWEKSHTLSVADFKKTEPDGIQGER